eukprot:CAMPEP_0179317800 /NCGR_PEP_ID=MMETSP0797-20121207/56495_1 /TAXON_ID=47934 /ORGANISM="Dinophysis acuminata, Strain DAEP01" /LENGTH=49 /DNA_ID= /DNA_START= /DNA_END= /DNA_ORIENTATION=
MTAVLYTAATKLVSCRLQNRQGGRRSTKHALQRVGRPPHGQTGCPNDTR